MKLSLAQLIALKWRYQKLDRNKWRSKKQRAVINQPYSALFAKNYESLCYKGCQFSAKFWITHEYESAWHQITCVTTLRKFILPTIFVWALNNFEKEIYVGSSKLFEQGRNLI